MMLMDGPLVFLTDGTDASLVGLANGAAFASATGWPMTVLHIHDANQSAARAERVAGALAALPSHAERPTMLTVPSSSLDSALAELSASPAVVLGVRPAQRRLLRRFLPSTGYARLAQRWATPVLVLPENMRNRPIGRVLFPADLAPRSDAAFDEAVALSRALDAELHILHVFGNDRRLPSEMDLERRSAARSPRELLDIDRDHLRGMVERAAKRGVPTQVHTAEGRAHIHILSYAAANAIDLILMASHGPRSVEDMFLGTTTGRVVAGATVPVIALRSKPVSAGMSLA